MLDTRLCMCYGSIALFNSMLHNIFLLYHIDVFVSIYKIDKLSFWVGETIFLVWNSCNDPLFGWISDKKYLTQSVGGHTVVLQRLRSLTWNGPFFAGVVPCLLGIVDLSPSAVCALLADLAVDSEVRTRLNFHCSLFGIFGALSVFMSYIVWDRHYLMTFRVFCVILAIVSAAGFLIATRILRDICHRDMTASKGHGVVSNGFHGEEEENTKTAIELNFSDDKMALKSFISQLAGHQNFVWFAAMNLIQVRLNVIQMSLCARISFIAPHLNNLYFTTLCNRHGTYVVIRGLFLVKLCLGVFMYLAGPDHLWLMCLFIASNRVFTEGTCRLLSLVISDLVDEDFVIHHRRQAVSALMFGTSAFVSKPGQTLAPLIGTWLLASQTGHDVFASGNSFGSIKMKFDPQQSAQHEVYRQGVFRLLVCVPVVCAVLQLAAWSNFTLHGGRLQWVKAARRGHKYTTV
ncbi:hypothetical protein NP493_21g09012 [Ridgeia piscesae]|uniref:Transmembrane protein 180 n=1 Tax=Ridgeia piscesae TaxID=27915 RepID=A0AAD9UKH6_RIDPI|nr:hypothetical protein NP493_21g09012 [Ridgeia piscesae]